MSLSRKMNRGIAKTRNAAGATHKLFAQTAAEIAGAFHEDACGKDAAFAQLWPKPEVFIRRNWQTFVPSARDSLLKILEGDYPETMKAPIFEAFLQDSALNAPQSHVDAALN